MVYVPKYASYPLTDWLLLLGAGSDVPQSIVMGRLSLMPCAATCPLESYIKYPMGVLPRPGSRTAEPSSNVTTLEMSLHVPTNCSPLPEILPGNVARELPCGVDPQTSANVTKRSLKIARCPIFSSTFRRLVSSPRSCPHFGSCHYCVPELAHEVRHLRFRSIMNGCRATRK